MLLLARAGAGWCDCYCPMTTPDAMTFSVRCMMASLRPSSSTTNRPISRPHITWKPVFCAQRQMGDQQHKQRDRHIRKARKKKEKRKNTVSPGGIGRAHPSALIQTAVVAVPLQQRCVCVCLLLRTSLHIFVSTS